MASSHPGRRLTTWKEIGSYIGRDARTAKRYEAERALPVYRMPGGGKSVVFAFTGEVDLWLRNTQFGELILPAAILSPGPSALGDALPREPDAPAPAGATTTEPRTGASPERRWIALGAVAAILAVCLAAGWRGLNRPARPAPAGPASAEAQRDYQLGRYAWNHRTPQSLQRAIDNFTQAVVQDPQFAAAYAGLADCYLLMPEFHGMSAADAYPRARAAALRAVALDPRLAAAHRALGFVSFYWDQNTTESEREFRVALKLDPDAAQTHHWFANTLATRGQAQDAVVEIDRASILDPTNTAILSDKGWVLMMAGQIGRARSLLTAVEATDPTYAPAYRYMGDALRLSGDDAGMLQQWKRSADLTQDRTLGAAVDAGLKVLPQGHTAVLKALVKTREALFAQGGVSGFELAGEEMDLGRTRQALDYLKQSEMTRDPAFLALSAAPEFLRLHADARFRRLQQPSSGSARLIAGDSRPASQD